MLRVVSLWSVRFAATNVAADKLFEVAPAVAVSTNIDTAATPNDVTVSLPNGGMNATDSVINTNGVLVKPKRSDPDRYPAPSPPTSSFGIGTNSEAFVDGGPLTFGPRAPTRFPRQVVPLKFTRQIVQLSIIDWTEILFQTIIHMQTAKQLSYEICIPNEIFFLVYKSHFFISLHLFNLYF
jgi:hypothetical protein